MSRHNRRKIHVRVSAPKINYTYGLPTLCETKQPHSTLSRPFLHAFDRDSDPSYREEQRIRWQHRVRDERHRLSLKRVFGGENDEYDEWDICLRMMDYFNGLDFIDAES